MKKFTFAGTLLSVMLSTSFGLAAEQGQTQVDPKAQFHRFFTQGQSKTFRGRAQGLSAFNLDLQMYIHYKDSLSEEGEKVFSLASDGNQIIHGTPVFPTSGKVVYEIRNAAGELEVFNLDSEDVTFGRKPFTMYLIESDKAYKTRVARLKILQEKIKDARYENAQGRMIAVVRFDLQKQDIQFFQVDSNKNLISSGVFHGAAAVPRVSSF